MDPTLLTELLKAIPDAAWGFLGGALAALIPVVMTNRHTRKLQLQQLESDSRERQRERQVILRRDVYLPAADAVASLVAAMAKIVAGDPSSAEQLNVGGQAFSAALTRIQMVAGSETVRHVGEYQRAFIKAVSLLQRRNHALMLRKADIDIAQKSRENAHAERMKLIEMMKAYNIDGGRDRDRFQRMEQQAAFVGQQFADAHSQWLRHVHAYETTRLEMVREYGSQIVELSKLQAPLLAAIRRELEASDETHALIEEETEKTAAVGLQTVLDVIPLIEQGIQNLGVEIETDEQQRRDASTQRR